MRLSPLKSMQGEVHLPGSKSLSNRALLLAWLAKGETELLNLLDSDDVRVMRAALADFEAGQHSFFLGNAGTAMRPLCAALCARDGEYLLHGEPRMSERPIGPLVDALRQLGARIDYPEKEGYPPVRTRGGLHGGMAKVDGSLSSQFLTALLMAAPLAHEPVTLELVGELVSRPYVDMTIALMARFGVKVEEADGRFLIAPQQYVSPGSLLVEGDASSASYFLAGAAIAGGPVRVRGVGKDSLQGDAHFAEVLAEMGAVVEWGRDFIEVRRGEGLRGIDRDLGDMPDAAMTLATTALFAEGPTTIRNVANWRIKETDRLAAMACELRKLGATVEEGDDFLRVEPPAEWHEAEIATYNDHRMAMCFSLAALGPVAVTILDPGCVSKTFPNYFAEFARLTAGE